MTTDPMCGMTVDSASALHAERDGQTFYFCVEHCRQKFMSTPATMKHEEEPHGFCQLSPPSPEPSDRSTARDTASYVCPMCPGVESGSRSR